ncbi:MAG: alpha/beta fold hydrolase [Candidatus Nanopelagicales bacterium]
MSTPPFVRLPPGIEASTVVTSRGRFAALRAHPTMPRLGSVLLVPGFTGSKEDFIAVLHPLAAAGYEVLTYDQRGQYETAGPDDPSAYDLDELATDLRSVATTLGTPTHLLGHSFGGLVARMAALQQPAAFASLVLLDSGPAALPTEAERARLTMLTSALAEHSAAAVWAAMQELARLEGREGPADPDVAAFLQRRFLANSPTGLAAKAAHLLTEPDRVDALAATGIPVLVAYGENEEAWPPSVQAEMARRLGASHAVIAGAAHSPNAEQPDAAAALMASFWDSRVRAD